LTITANILMSLAIDQFGWFGLNVHPLTAGRIVGAVLMICGIVLIAKF
jgi:transporter family-2 protein